MPETPLRNQNLKVSEENMTIKKEPLINNIGQLSDKNLWLSYGLTIKELKKRKLIRTRNIAGERGEQLAIELYGSIAGEINLQAAPEGTQNVDALSRKGERYAIKTVTAPGRTTGVFYGLNPPEDEGTESKKFEYVIIVIIDKLYKPLKIIECSWDNFLKLKKWHKTMRAWNISITAKLEKESRLVYDESKIK